MVYIFFVQPGDMMTFDNEISIMQSVGDLKEKIEEKCRIPLTEQVLLINGGEPLDAQKNLCSYMAGTDTNPIYLFSTNYDMAKLDILRSRRYDDSDLKQRLVDCLSLPVSLATVKTRAELAQDFCNVASLQLEFCENMVHEQHLQQQGWSAVIANLEDIVAEFRKRWDLFLKMYEDFIADKDAYNSFLQSFENDKEILQKIPVIDTLLEPQDGSKISENTTSTSETEPSKEISLFEWISSNDTKNSLDELYELCKSNLKKFEKEIMPSLAKQINDTLQSAEKPERKEIEGLGKRLFDLEELLRKIKKYVQHQCDMSQSFQQNQNSAANMRDTSILPDLCTTHIQQLGLIRQCHQKFMDDRNRIVKAKYELSKSLCARICWVQNVEEKIAELDSLLVYFHEHLQRLRKHLEVFQQLHLAPITYMNAVVEVVRRRSFSQIFLLWASDLACQNLTIHNEEVTRRKEFSSQFEGHFLNSLFPGMGDVPPAFAIEAPPMFDNNLPNISKEDVDKLRKDVPDFSESLMLPDMNHVVSFFMGKISGKGKEDKVDDATAVEEKLIQAVSDVGLASNLDKNLLKATSSEPCLVSAPGLPNLKDDKGCESETDTDEFEKVGQSPLELNFPQGVATGAVPKVTEKQDASTSTEDNLQISRTEHDKLKALFLNISDIAKLATSNLRNDLNEFKAQFANESRVLCKQYEDLGTSWDTLVLQVDRNQKDLVECMKRESDDEKDRFRYNLMEKEDVIRRLEEDKRVMENRIQEMCTQMKSLEENLAMQNSESASRIDDLLRQLHEKDADKEKCLKELSETFKTEHKAEIDNIKSRFKLMTMERSPSLTSLEKEKPGDYSSLPSSASTLLAQITENFELDKEKALTEERNHWQKMLEENKKEMQRSFEDLAKRMSEDKEKQISILTERENNLNLEIVKYKTTIRQLAECQEDRRDSEMLNHMEALQKENEDLKKELEKLKISSELLVTSGGVPEGKSELTASLESASSNSGMSKSDIVPDRSHRLNIDSCKTGDIVLVFWDQAHESFKVLQESKHPFFLHSDCLEKLGLAVAEGKPNKTHCTGEVIEKEICQVCKSDNRFKVPKGSKFFLVKVKPIAPLSQLRQKDLSQSSSDFVEQQPMEIGAKGKILIIEQPEELIAKSIEKQLAQDSGIVDNVEQGTAATEHSDRLSEEQIWSLQEKDKLIQELQEREKQLNIEISNYKSKIQQLTESQEEKKESEEIEVVRKEREELQEELAKMKSEKEALMSASVVLCEGKPDGTTSPLATSPPSSDLSKNELISTRPHRLNIDSCKEGDIVLLLWDQAHENFRVLQESKHTYFLNSNCIENLGLAITDGKPNKLYCTGEVVDKEYCQTRKSENRYKVPKGAKFFRVRLKPITSLRRNSKDLSQSSYTSRYFSAMSASQSVIATLDPLIEESQSAPTVDDQQPIKQSRGQSVETPEMGRSDSENSRNEGVIQPEVEADVKHFAEDSGIEEATVALENNDRCEDDSCKEVIEQSANVSTNWFEAMFRSMFSK